MDHLIAIKYAGRCHECGAVLPAGSEARYYGHGILYGIACHPQRNGHKGNGRKPDSVAESPSRKREGVMRQRS